MYSLYEYHLQALSSGTGLHSPHPYQSQPWDWLLVTRPGAFFYECYTGPVAGPSHYCPGRAAPLQGRCVALFLRVSPAQ